MKKVFIAVSPGFYKTNLFNELIKKEDILVVYTGSYDKRTRNSDFFKGEKRFDYITFSGTRVKRLFRVLYFLISISYKEIIIGGYDNVFCWVPLLVTSKKKCSLIVESTFRETVTHGLRHFLKKIFISRLSRVYAPGTPHAKLVKELGFTGEIRYIKSVGLINIVPQPSYSRRNHVQNFLFVGRLIPEKNLSWLISIFKKHLDLKLTIVGFGEQEQYLKSLATTDNIIFIGAVDNMKLPCFYQQADVFILPSITETWGLVVEEALNNGTPVMCSHMVGCADDLVIERKSGVVFQLNNENDFEEKLKDICNVEKYNMYRRNVSMMSFEKHKSSVVDAFVN